MGGTVGKTSEMSADYCEYARWLYGRGISIKELSQTFNVSWPAMKKVVQGADYVPARYKNGVACLKA